MIGQQQSEIQVFDLPSHHLPAGFLATSTPFPTSSQTEVATRVEY